MQHSSWDIETYGRLLQQERHREAEQARLLDAAGVAPGSGLAAFGSRVARFVATLSDRLSSGSRTPAAPPAPAPTASAPTPRLKPVRAAEPYAAMAVVARSSATERPVRVGDC